MAVVEALVTAVIVIFVLGGAFAGLFWLYYFIRPNEDFEHNDDETEGGEKRID